MKNFADLVDMCPTMGIGDEVVATSGIEDEIVAM